MSPARNRLNANEVAVLATLAVLAISLIVAVCVLQLARATPRVEKKPSLVTVSASELLRSDRPPLGAADAKYTLVEFGDYQCPACLTALSVVRAGVTKERGRLRFAYRHLPLPMHLSAVPAARAVEAAAAQHKLWEMHEAVIALNGNISEARLNRVAQSLKLDMQQFEHDRAGSGADAVRQDIDLADRLSVRATPTFFLACPSGAVYRLPDLTWAERAMREFR